MEGTVKGPPGMRWIILILPWVARLALGLVFAYAGAAKVLAMGAFLDNIENYQMLPHAAAVALSVYLPFLEIGCGLALLSRRLERGALLLIGGMTAVFIIALLSAWVRGLNIECGCFGSGGARGEYGLALIRDAVLLATVWLLWKRSGERSPGSGWRFQKMFGP